MYFKHSRYNAMAIICKKFSRVVSTTAETPPSSAKSGGAREGSSVHKQQRDGSALDPR